MQPIAVDTQVISQLISDWTNPRTQRIFHKLVENLEQFHQVYIDKTNNGSNWLNNFREVRNNINDFNVKKLFDDLIGPRNIKYIPVKINQDTDPILELTRQTPDKIGLSSVQKVIDDLKFYDLTLFNSVDYNTQNYLFRIPKIITMPPGEELKDLKSFAPYLRNAIKIEFCDLFLFKNPQYEDDAEFLFSILCICKNIKEIEIHCEPNKLNILQKKVRDRLQKEFGKNIFTDFKKYNPATSNVNHDRFIIIDNDKISIRFTCSFNNLRKTSSGGFKVIDSFLVEFSQGRKYYD